MSARRLSIRLTQELERRLATEAKKTGRGESEIVREALADYLNKQAAGPSAYDIAKKMGLIGCAKGLPSDLSTNPAYMEGFGRD
jgi:hypothetical protein